MVEITDDNNNSNGNDGGVFPGMDEVVDNINTLNANNEPSIEEQGEISDDHF